MFSLFKSRKQRKQPGPNEFLDNVVVGIVTRCIGVQGKWAAFMQRKTNRLSLQARKICLLLFCLLSIGCSLYLIVGSVTGTSNKHLGVASIRVPLHATQNGDENTRSSLLITKKEVERIELFRRHMDSLGESAPGSKHRDSLLALRPGLMDSIRMIEQLYQLQTLKTK
jgi:hypothetical protein